MLPNNHQHELQPVPNQNPEHPPVLQPAPYAAGEVVVNNNGPQLDGLAAFYNPAAQQILANAQAGDNANAAEENNHVPAPLAFGFSGGR